MLFAELLYVSLTWQQPSGEVFKHPPQSVCPPPHLTLLITKGSPMSCCNVHFNKTRAFCQHCTYLVVMWLLHPGLCDKRWRVSVCLLFCLLACLPVGLSVCLSAGLSCCLLACLPVCLSVCLPVYSVHHGIDVILVSITGTRDQIMLCDLGCVCGRIRLMY